VADELIAIATDPTQGRGRSLVVLALWRMKNTRERVIPVLINLLDDPDVGGYAVMALGKLKAREARSRLEHLDPKQDWVGKELKKALAKIPV